MAEFYQPEIVMRLRQLEADMRARLPTWEWRGIRMPSDVRIGIIGKPPGRQTLGAWVWAKDYDEEPEETVDHLHTSFCELLAEDSELAKAKARIAELEAIVVQRDTDAELGRALRGLRSRVPVSFAMHITPEVDALLYYIMWCRPSGIANATQMYDDPLPAIQEYNRRKSTQGG